MDFKAPQEIHLVKQYLVNFTDLAGIVNATDHKTKPIFTGFMYGKLSKFLTLHQMDMYNIHIKQCDMFLIYMP